MKIKGNLELAEEGFFDPDLLETIYFQKYREAYGKSKGLGLLNPYRNYISYLSYLSSIFCYNEQHARSFTKRIKSEPENWNNCEAVAAEIIVYESYIRLVNERLIRGIHMESKSADVIIERMDRSKYYLEVFCLMPDINPPKDSKEIRAQSILSHTQHSAASVRQKLLRKMRQQKQFKPGRENYAVIELNHPTIAMDFTVLSSLSDGYKVHFDRETLEQTTEGYDWSSSVFQLPETRGLNGVIWFHLGHYNCRKIIINPNIDKC
jgi:hypothetical protein